MVTRILDLIKKLEGKQYSKTDNQELAELYELVADNCCDRDSFIKQSSFTMELLHENKLEEELEKQWLFYADNIFGSCLETRIYKDRSLLSWEEWEQVVDYYRYGALAKEIKALGLYVCAQRLGVSDPMYCYQLTMEAFSLNPKLSVNLGVEYEYKDDEADVHLTTECPICGGKEAVPYYCSPQLLKLDHKSAYPPCKLWMKCNCCDNYYTYNFPLERLGNINGHYVGETVDGVLEPKVPLELYSDIFNRMRDLSSGGDYLEIGVGRGDMIAVAQEFGFHAEAVDICKEDCERVSAALNVEIQWCDVMDYQTDRRYDAIVMGDVLEHVAAPVRLLEKVKSLMKKDGVLWISTPNYNCGYARMEKFTHCMWHELNHYTYMSLESLKKILDSMGLVIVSYNISKRYVGSMELFIKREEDM